MSQLTKRLERAIAITESENDGMFLRGVLDDVIALEAQLKRFQTHNEIESDYLTEEQLDALRQR